MSEPLFRLTYDGGDADAHVMDMRLLGLSLLGADRITSDGLIILATGRAPKRGERAPIITKVREPVAGSYDLPGMIQEAAWLLNLGLPIAQQVIAAHLSGWWSLVKAHHSGRPDLAERAMQSLLEMNRDHLAARDAHDARAHQERMAYAEILRVTLAIQQKPLEQFVAPVGRSVSSATVRTGSASPVSVEAEEAEAIRAMGALTWTDLEEIRLKTDGFRFHTSGLSIENPERDGFLMAKVSDPRFEQQENAYTAAAQRRAEVIILGRKGYRGGELVKIDIVDFIRELNA